MDLFSESQNLTIDKISCFLIVRYYLYAHYNIIYYILGIIIFKYMKRNTRQCQIWLKYNTIVNSKIKLFII